MPTFSERMGFKPAKSMVQANTMDDALRNSLWNVVYEELMWIVDQYRLDTFLKTMWKQHLKLAVDEVPGGTTSYMIAKVKERFYYFDFNEVYDFIEFMAQAEEHQSFRSDCNRVLEDELSAYRFIGSQLVPISQGDEVASVEQAIEDTSAIAGARTHLQAAIDILANRDAPDYRNSIKESVSAVEAIVNVINGKRGTLGQALKKVGFVHPSLEKGFGALYGWTSDAEGIRHALMDEPTVGQAEARFMLIACSAFVSLLVAQAAEAGLDIES